MSTDEWNTPKWIADLLGGFDFDPCSNPHSHVKAFAVCSRTGVPLQSEGHGSDGLVRNWSLYESVFINPPYSDVGPWATKLANYRGSWCALVKLDPTTKWWAALMSARPAVAPFRKRIKFQGDKAMTANFPSVLVYKGWTPSDDLAKHLWIGLGRTTKRRVRNGDAGAVIEILEDA